MADASTSMLIEIQTAMDAGAIDLAGQKMQTLIANQQATAQTAQAATQAQTAHDMALQKAAGSMRKITGGVNGLSIALQGGQASAIGLQQSLGAMGEVGLTAGSIVGAALAGWKLGKMIDEVTRFSADLAKVFVDGQDVQIRALQRQADAAQKTIDTNQKLGDVKLEGLLAEYNAATTQAEKLCKAIDSAKVAQEEFNTATSNLEVAKIDVENLPEEEKTQKKAELKSAREQRRIADDKARLEQEVATREDAIKQMDVLSKKYTNETVSETMNFQQREAAQKKVVQLEDDRKKEVDAIYAAKQKIQVLDLNAETEAIKSVATKQKHTKAEKAQAEQNTLDAYKAAADKKKADIELKKQAVDAQLKAEIELSKQSAEQKQTEATDTREQADAYTAPVVKGSFKTKAQKQAIHKDRSLEVAALEAQATFENATGKTARLEKRLQDYDDSVVTAIERIEAELDRKIKLMDSKTKNRP